NAKVSGNAEVWVDAKVSDNAKVSGNAEVWGNAKVSELGDLIVFKNHWSSGRHFTYTKSNKMWKVGCFYGTGQELIEKAYRDSEKSGNYYKACVDFVENLEKLGD
ncbi:TPA: polymer-forming cytoskeletal protein, partial [Streptococcus suis]|nr:polymer-forming cytoskeletal protein [Streptococcus suis]